MAALKPLSFASAFKKALVWSVPDPVQDMPDGDASLNRVTDMRTSVRGKEDLLNRDQGGVPNLFNREHINSDSPIELLERIKIDKPEWFQDTFNGEIFPIPNSGRGSVRNFNTVKVDRSERMVALSKLLEKGHLVLNEGGTTLLVREQTDPDSTAQLGIKKYPRVLIIQVDLTEPYNTNNILPNNIMKIGQSQEYQLRSIIQTYKTSGHYIVLSTTHDEDVYSKTCNEGQTNYINVCSDERSLHEDYIYIYQEISNLTKITSKNGEMHNKNFQPEFLEAQSNPPPSGQSSILIRKAIENATNHGVNLSPSTLIKADGNCMFSAAIGNINSRKCFKQKITLTATQARELWLNNTHDVVREFAGEDKVDFEIQWNALKYKNIYETKLGDFVMSAIAHTLKHNILIFNTRHMNAHDPIAVVKADQMAGVKAKSEIPLVLAYDGTHYEHLIPTCDSDVAKTCELVNKYTSGTYNFNWDNVPPSSYAQALKQNISLPGRPVIPDDFITPTKKPDKQPSKRPHKACSELETKHNKQCPPKISKCRKDTTLPTSVTNQCVLNLKNRFDLLEEENFQVSDKKSHHNKCNLLEEEISLNNSCDSTQTGVQNLGVNNEEHVDLTIKSSKYKKRNIRRNLISKQFEEGGIGVDLTTNKGKRKNSQLGCKSETPRKKSKTDGQTTSPQERFSRKEVFESKPIYKQDWRTAQKQVRRPREPFYSPNWDHPYSNTPKKGSKIPESITNSKIKHTGNENGAEDHSYSCAGDTGTTHNTKEPRQKKGGDPKLFPPNPSTAENIYHDLPEYFGTEWDNFRTRKSTNLTVGSINVRGLGNIKKTQLAEMGDTLGLDLLATYEHHKDDSKFRTNFSINNKAMAVRGYNNVSTHRPAQCGGGISWYWKKNLNVEPWDGPELPDHLIPFAVERCWVKVICSTETWYLGAVYMPTENKSQEHQEKFSKILEILDLDLQALKKLDAPSILYGDFNAHIGTEQDRYGVEGNNKGVGRNGQLLYTWLDKWGKTIVNSQAFTQGKWTWEGPSSKSILDLMIIDKNMMGHIDALTIDEKRMSSTMKTDHHLMVSLLNTGYARIKWKTPRTKAWNFDTLDKKAFCKELKNQIAKIHRGSEDASELNYQIKDAVLKTLQATAEETRGNGKKTWAPPKAKEIDALIRELELEKYSIFNKLQSNRASPQKMTKENSVLISSLGKIRDKIDTLLQEKFRVILSFQDENNAKLRKLISKKGTSSSKYWSIIRDTDRSAINALRKRDGSLSTSKKETLNTARDYFQNLFKATGDSDPDSEPSTSSASINTAQSRKLLKHTNVQKVTKLLKNLKNRKASGPDGIPNEPFKIGGKLLAPLLTRLFNLVLSNQDSPLDWNTGLMHLIYKGKGDINDLTNYRGITVNNAVSKIFTTLINDRLNSLVEQSGVLGNIQQGGRAGKRATDSLFILRTLIEKALKSGKPIDRDIALIFIDLSKAYDCVPHQKLWNKLLSMGLHADFIKLLNSLYNKSTVKVSVNGHLSGDVFYNRGIKQGCVLSPILFILYISDVGKLLEGHPEGFKLQGYRINGLLYVDDLIIIGQNSKEVEHLLAKVQGLLERAGMEINCSKSNILSCKDVQLKADISLMSSWDALLGTIKRAPKYKYLGVRVTTDSANGIFKEAVKACKSKLKAHAGIILGLTNHDFDPVVNGLNLWSSVAVSAALYGAEVIKFSQEDIRELDNIQAGFLAHLLSQRNSVSHAALRNETGVQTIAQVVTKMKLKYWHHLSKYPKDTWLGAAYRECFPENTQGHNDLGQSAWKSNYASEIKLIKATIGLPESKVFPTKSMAKRSINSLSQKYFLEIDNKAIESQNEHSLRAFPKSSFTGKPLKYLSSIKDRKTLTQFRLGNAGLGNRMMNPIKTCPLCKNGPNTESHLVFDCQQVADVRAKAGKAICFSEFLQLTSTLPSADKRLQHFLRATGTTPEILQRRAEFLKSLLELHNDELAKCNIDLQANKPILTLAEKCPLCDFTSHTTAGIKIHKGRMHKTPK